MRQVAMRKAGLVEKRVAFGLAMVGTLAGAPAVAAAAECAGTHGKELQACLRERRPAEFEQVEVACAEAEKGAARWACRRDRYATMGIVIEPPVLAERSSPPTSGSLHGTAAAEAHHSEAPSEAAEASAPGEAPGEYGSFPVAPPTAEVERGDEHESEPAEEKPLLKALGAANDFLRAASTVCEVHDVVPLTIQVWVSNPQDVAVKQEGELTVALGNAAAYFGLTDSVDSKVYEGVAERARDSFAERGIAADVSHGEYRLAGGAVHTWSKGVASSRTIPPGRYHLVNITVHDSIAVACQEKGGLVGLAVQAGATSFVHGEVREGVEQKVLKQLARNGAVAYVIGPR